MVQLEVTNFVCIEAWVDVDDYKGPGLLELEFSLVPIQYPYFVSQLKGFPKRFLDFLSPFCLLFPLLCLIWFHSLGVWSGLVLGKLSRTLFLDQMRLGFYPTISF